ncbi:MAG: carbohydrate kinase family protein [Methanobrevibacter sp.]|jgi:ribokinase|nr:carbohydrate kinase family protein [Candidatus Methanovirga meridionalis]
MDHIPIDVVGFGALNLDIIYHVNEIAKHDEESYIKSKSISCGGSASNTIIGLSNFGIKTSYIGKIANDDEGEILEMSLMKNGVYLNNLIYADEGSSGKVIGFVDKKGNRALYVDSGVNDEIDISQINIQEVINSDMIHYTSFVGNSMHAQIELIDYLSKDTVLSFDPGMIYVKKGFSTIEKILDRTNILLINEMELNILIKSILNNELDYFKDMAKYLHDKGIENVIVKRGEKGVYGINNDFEVELPANKVEVIDTTAAGDSFNAGFLYSYLNSYSLEKSLKIANWVASTSVTSIGTNGLPNLSQLKEFENSIY